MSRVVTQPTTSQGSSTVKVPHEKIAMRAYERWCKRGCPQGTSEQDWIEAETELRAEYSRGGSQPTQGAAPRR